MVRVGYVVAALLVTAAAGAEELPAPVCGRESVLDRVDAMLRRAGRPMRLLAEPVGEISSDPGGIAANRIVHCAVRGQVLGFDTNRYGMQPVNELFVVRYTLELRRNGIFIQLQ